MTPGRHGDLETRRPGDKNQETRSKNQVPRDKKQVASSVGRKASLYAKLEIRLRLRSTLIAFWEFSYLFIFRHLGFLGN